MEYVIIWEVDALTESVAKRKVAQPSRVTRGQCMASPSSENQSPRAPTPKCVVGVLRNFDTCVTFCYSIFVISM